MFVLEYKKLYIIREPMLKNCTTQTHRWKQFAVCEAREPLESILANQKDKENWRIEEYPT